LKHASVEELESWAKDAEPKDNGPANKFEYRLLLKYCDAGVSCPAIYFY